MKPQSKLPFLIVPLLLLSGCTDENHRHLAKIYIPEGYVGWVRVEYAVEGADPLPVEWQLPPPMLRNREVIPPSGLLRTSTYLTNTLGGDFYFYNGDTVTRAPDTIALCELTSLYNFEFTDPNEKQQFVTYFIGPPSEEYRCDELERFKTGKRHPVWAAPNLADLPRVGNLNVQSPP